MNILVIDGNRNCEDGFGTLILEMNQVYHLEITNSDKASIGNS